MIARSYTKMRCTLIPFFDCRVYIYNHKVDATLGVIPDPELSYSVGVPTGGDTAGRVNAFGLGLAWNVTSLISRKSKVSEAKAHGDAVDLDIAWQEWQVAQGAKAAVYQLSGSQSQLALLEQVRQQLAENLAHVQKAVSAGSMTISDLNAVRVADSHLNERLLALEKQADQQRLKLFRLMGLPADSQIRFLNEQIAAAQMAKADLGKLAEDYRRALTDGRTNALIFYAAWKDLIDAQTRIVGLKGQLAQAGVALELATGFYKIPGSGLSSEVVSKASGVDKKQ